MAYHVELTARASRDPGRIYREINAANSEQARAWFNGLEVAILSLDQHPARCPVTPEDANLRHLLYGNRRFIYRIIYTIHEQSQVVTVLHIRHGMRRRYAAEGN
ncbi:MAG: type II toxin-antitoxin system RelE/ParE family toxin [Acetobacteraceae bacterium]|jgi:plasmid stabilization system protein ParE